jgi:N4-(beta-N-acetylglucosaminyl)-L-asparaginase
MSRRKFIKKSALAIGSVMLAKYSSASEFDTDELSINSIKPIVISTWNHGLEANKAAWEVLSKGGTALDAVEKGVMVTESDSNNRSVGLGGLPDKKGKVTLDACIMNHENECGAVAFLQDIEHPISVARKVMEETPHVMIVGKGAYEFAIEQGFEKQNLLTPEAKEAWKNWKKSENQKKPEVNSENHDTIGMLAMDKFGNISGACTTSGWAFKLHGRVGDSPIIGSGLFIDNEIGGACATGLGEAVIRIAGSHTVVELMRQGKSPNEACKLAVERIIQKHKNIEGLQVGFLAINSKGEIGSYSVYAGFNMAYKNETTEKMIDAKYKMEW